MCFFGDVEFEAALSRSNFGVSDGLLLNWRGLSCGPIIPKLHYRNSESVPKFEVRVRLPVHYRMSEIKFIC